MAFDFPNAPVENQEFVPQGGPTYVYKAPRWVIKTPPPPAGGYDNEMAQDAVAQAIANGTHSNIVITYDDASNALSFAAPSVGSGFSGTIGD